MGTEVLKSGHSSGGLVLYGAPSKSCPFSLSRWCAVSLATNPREPWPTAMLTLGGGRGLLCSTMYVAAALRCISRTAPATGCTSTTAGILKMQASGVNVSLDALASFG